MGDADSTIENRIDNSGTNSNADFLKVGHHGNATSSSSAFLSNAQPQIRIIEVGAGNPYGPDISDTGSPIPPTPEKTTKSKFIRGDG